MRGLYHHLAALSLAIGISAFSVATAQAGAISIDISSLVNSDLTAYSGGWNYPQHGGPLTVGGIPFTLAIGKNSDTAVIQSSIAGGVSQTYSLPVNLFGVTSAYTLINSAFGTCGANVGELDFIGSSNTFTYTLTEGTNVRDHFHGGFCGTVNNSVQTANFGGGVDRLDMQSIGLPAAFATDTLQRIDFKSFGQGWNGSPFLAGLTVDPASPDTSAVPEPTLWPVGLIAIVLMSLARRHWGQRSTS
jgi:hypothetical protein